MFILIEQSLENDTECQKRGPYKEFLKEAKSEKILDSSFSKKKRQEQASNNTVENNKNQPNSFDLNKNNENKLPEPDVNMLNAECYHNPIRCR